MAAMDGADVIARLATLVDKQGLVTEPEGLAPFVEDWRHRATARALCAVRPRHLDQVVAIVKFCAETRTPLIPQSGNTGLAFGALPLDHPHAVVMSLGRMNAVRRIDSLAMIMEVETGCTLRGAKDAAEAVNRYLPISIGSEGTAQIGGVISTNAGGINVLRYGMTRNAVLGLEVVLADGTVTRGLRSLRKDNAGYDWKQMFIGAEGTLGVVTAAVMKLWPKPTREATAFVALDSPDAVLKLLGLAQDHLGDSLSAFEMMADSCLEVVDRHFGAKAPVPPGKWNVLMQAGSTLSGLDEALEGMLATAIEEGIAQDAAIAQNSMQAAQMWVIRERMATLEGREGPMITHDISVPIEKIPDFVAQASERVKQLYPAARPYPFGHAGDGNLHFNIFVSKDMNTKALTDAVHDVAVSLGGSISAEHGIGRYRRDALPSNKSAEEIALMRRIKTALDPDGIMNPGSILPA